MYTTSCWSFVFIFFLLLFWCTVIFFLSLLLLFPHVELLYVAFYILVLARHFCLFLAFFSLSCPHQVGLPCLAFCFLFGMQGQGRKQPLNPGGQDKNISSSIFPNFPAFSHIFPHICSILFLILIFLMGGLPI